MSSAAHADAPMPLAEAAECCGRLELFGVESRIDDGYCANCPLLIEGRQRRENPNVMRAARAL